jgi:anti-sigma factor RsiW
MSDLERTELEQMHEELTSYLDGELDGDEVRRVEERLVRDPSYQAELQRLDRAWDLLDRLPRNAVSDAFTKSTIEMVAVAASQEADAVHVAWPLKQRRQRIASALAVLAAGFAGFAIGHWAWPNPNQKLLEDLPVLQNFELYYQADNIDFLHLLESENLFAEGEGDHAG